MIEHAESQQQQQVSNYNDVNSFLSRILQKFGEGDYERARKMFYSSLGGFSRLFDDAFIIGCAANEMRATSQIKAGKKRHMVMHSKFCADLILYSKLIFRQNKKSFEYNEGMEEGRSYFKVLGYSRLVDFKNLYLKHASDLSRLSADRTSTEMLDYIYHVVCVFGGIWREETLQGIAKIYMSNLPAETKFYSVQNELSFCMSDFGVFKPPNYVEIIMPPSLEDVPKSLEEILLYAVKS